jgi:hypothetical protein
MMGSALLRETPVTSNLGLRKARKADNNPRIIVPPLDRVTGKVGIAHEFVTDAPFLFRYEGAAVSQAALFVYPAAFLMYPTVSL